MRKRLHAAAHIPHPAIHQKTGKTVTVTWSRPAHTELDGEQRPATKELHVEVVPAAYRLLA
jgi:diacylglycerol kinase family enzyme